VIVSTEDQEIAAIAREWGAEVPFMRPADLAGDEAPGVAPVLHAMAQLPEHEEILLLQPTSPLRGHAEIQALLALASSGDAPSIASVSEAREHPAWMYRMGADGRLEGIAGFEQVARRQDLSAIYSLNGAMYWARTDWIRRQEALFGADTVGFVMNWENSVDIDTIIDWRLAEILLTERLEPKR
jgi:CMP-N-acetylneuraminic acid synthetase